MFSVPRLSRRFVRWTLVLALLVASYAAAGFWLVPRLAANALRETLSERYQRSARVAAVSFNPFSFELEIHGFSVPDADAGPLLSFERLYVNLGLISVLRGGLSFQAIAVDKPSTRVVRRANGTLNLADFMAEADERGDAEAPPRLWIDELVIRDGRATLVDLERPQPLTLQLGPITFQARSFSTRSEGNEYSLAVQSPRGEQLTWRGDFAVAPLASNGKFSLRNIQAQTLAEIAAERIPFQLTRGQVAADGSYALGSRGKDVQLRLDVARLLLESIGVRVRGEANDAVFSPSLTVSNIQLDLKAQTVSVEQVLAQGLQVAAVRGSTGELNLARLLPAAAPSLDDPPPTTQVKPWSITVPRVELRAADLKLEDQHTTQPARFQLAPLDLTVDGFASPTVEPLKIELVTRVNETGRFAAQGQLDLATLAGQFSLDASALPLPPAQPYLDAAVGFNLISGKANAKGTLDVSLTKGVHFAGQVGIDDLKTTDKELAEDFVKWTSLKLDGLDVQSEPLAVRIAEVSVTEPYARVAISETGATNIQDVLSPRHAQAPANDSAAPAPTAPPAEATALPIEIDLVRVNAGSVNFSDRSIKPNFETGIQTLSGTIKGLSARPDARADVQLEGQVDRYTPVKITGKVNYFAAVTYTDLRLAFRNLELTSLSPYSGKFAGYRIERGKLKVNLNYLVKKRRLDAKHKIVIDQLQLGDAVESPDATSLPVKLAIALLKDRNGVIDLDIPVSGNLDDPQFRVWPIIWQVVVNLLTKIVTSPFALLGSLFGAGEEISYVDFTPASSELSAATKAKLQTLTKALVERPALNLDLPLVIKPDVDGPALLELRWQAERERLARRKLGARANDAAALAKELTTPKDYRALLEAAYREAYGKKPAYPQPPAAAVPRPTPAPTIQDRKPPPTAAKAPPAYPDSEAIKWLEPKLRAKISIGPSDFEELARERAQQVQAVILDQTGIDPSRVFVITGDPLAPDAPLRMQLALH